MKTAMDPGNCHCIEGMGRTKSKARDIGLALREAREWARVSVNDMAEAISKPPQYLRDMERGKRNWTLRAIKAYLAKLGPRIKIEETYD